MRLSVFTKLVSGALLLIFPLTVMASDSAAIVVPAVAVSLNGQAIERAQAVFSGDLIQTVTHPANIIQSGVVILINPHSAVAWNSNLPSLMSGEISVTTTDRLATVVYNVEVQPKDPSAQYVITALSGSLTIGAKKGPLRVTDGSTTILIPEGQALVAPTEKADGDKQDKTKTSSTPDGTVVIEVPAKTRVALSKGKLVAIVVALGAAGAVAAVLVSRKKSASPTN